MPRKFESELVIAVIAAGNFKRMRDYSLLSPRFGTNEFLLFLSPSLCLMPRCLENSFFSQVLRFSASPVADVGRMFSWLVVAEICGASWFGVGNVDPPHDDDRTPEDAEPQGRHECASSFLYRYFTFCFR